MFCILEALVESLEMLICREREEIIFEGERWLHRSPDEHAMCRGSSNNEMEVALE